jgi:predicted Zn-dependent protease
MNTWEADKPSEQARTSIYWAGNTIQEADLRINNKNFSFYIDSPAKDTDVQLTSLLVHELGHVLGLKHNDQEPSVMATYLAMHTIRKDLSAQDLTSIECEY